MVLAGGRNDATTLWKLPINRAGVPGKVLTIIESLDLDLQPNQSMHYMAHNVYTLPYKYKQNQLKYMHQSNFATIIQVIHNNQLEGIQFMKADLV